MSAKTSKNIYRQIREEAGLTREQASLRMDGISPSMIEKIEYDQKVPTPFDVVQMSKCYERPELCNYYCNRECEIGKQKIHGSEEIDELPAIVLETVAGLNEIHPMISKLIEIARDGKIAEHEMASFAKIKKTLDEIAVASNELNVWIEKTIIQNHLDGEMLNEELKQLKNK